MGGQAGRWVVLVLLAAIIVACGGGAAPSLPSATTDPSASVPVLGEAELAVCDGTVRMSQGVARIRDARVRRGADGRLESALGLVVEGQQLVLEYATRRMRARVRTLGFAVTNMTIAVEDFRTTDRVEAAASNIKRRATALRRSIESFRSWLGCPGSVADDEAGDDASAAPMEGPSAAPVG